MKLMKEIADYLVGRRDIQILATGNGTIGERIIAVQLRRVWEKFTYTASVFNPHEKERWHYYGQAYAIEEQRLDKDGALCKEQKALVDGLGAVGTRVVLAATVNWVKESLGPEPQNWNDYVRRVEK